jgi:diguanylate cyclase (GGDEF)-like protein/PAS domain S-box-containing protein
MIRQGKLLRMNAEPDGLDQKAEPTALEPHLSPQADVDRIEMWLQFHELQKTQAALKLALERYRMLYEFSPVAFLSLSSDSTILEINLTGVRLLGVDRREILHRRFSGFVAPPDLDRCQRFLKMATGMRDHQAIPLALRRGDGSVFHVQMDCEPMHEEDPSVALRCTLTDISEHVKAEAEIKKLAYYDVLTGLPNRRLLFDRWRQAMALSARTQDHGAVLLVDLDDFKTLNDTHGHDVGDLMLQQVATQLSRCGRAEDTVARLGGDEFIVMLQGLGKDPIKAAMETRKVGLKVCDALYGSRQLGPVECHASASIGIALFCGNRESINDLLKHADLALYRAKAAGGGAVHIFEAQMQSLVEARAILENDLRRAVDTDELTVYFQPQVNIEGCLTGAETLLRWLHPARGLLAPMEFISIAEEKGIIRHLDRIALSKACAQLKTWSYSSATAHLTLSVNVSGRQFSQPNFVAQTQEWIDRSSIDPRKLVLEITESTIIGNLTEAKRKINALKEHGVKFSLDDFGIGYSSLSYLRELPLDEIKIDTLFVQGILRNQKDAIIAGNIIDLGMKLGMVVIAEGVETEEQRKLLADLGCTTFQGYLFGHAVPVCDLMLTPLPPRA